MSHVKGNLMKIDDKLVGKAIARLREMRGLTQVQLNELVGISTIQHIEQGRNSVSLTSLNKIAAALKVPAACIVLLGSPIEKGDKVLSSLQTLLEKSIRLEAGEKSPRTKKKVRKVGKKGPAQALKRGSKKTPVVA